MIETIETSLALPPAGGTFGEEELAGLPDAARRYLRASIGIGVPLARAARIGMRGSIRIGKRWLPFRAREVLAPERGFLWSARVAGGIITGSDRFAGDAGSMSWKVFGVVPIVRRGGSDVSLSAAARAGGEALWLPTAMLPRFGVSWEEIDPNRVTVTFRVGSDPIALDIRIADDGRPRAVTFERWGDPDETGSWGFHPFGMVVDEVATMDGLTIPTSGRAGWFHGTDRWNQGIFFRYRITDLQIGRAGAPDERRKTREPVS